MRTLEEYTNHYSEIFVNDKENYLEMRDLNVLFPNGKYFNGQLEDLYKDENYIKYKDSKLVSSLIPADLVICAIDANLSLRELIDNSLERASPICFLYAFNIFLFGGWFQRVEVLGTKAMEIISNTKHRQIKILILQVVLVFDLK